MGAEQSRDFSGEVKALKGKVDSGVYSTLVSCAKVLGKIEKELLELPANSQKNVFPEFDKQKEAYDEFIEVHQTHFSAKESNMCEEDAIAAHRLSHQLQRKWSEKGLLCSVSFPKFQKNTSNKELISILEGCGRFYRSCARTADLHSTKYQKMLDMIATIEMEIFLKRKPIEFDAVARGVSNVLRCHSDVYESFKEDVGFSPSAAENVVTRTMKLLDYIRHADSLNDDLDKRKRVGILSGLAFQLTQKWGTCLTSLTILLHELASVHFKTATFLLEKNEFRQTISLNADAMRPILEGSQCLTKLMDELPSHASDCITSTINREFHLLYGDNVDSSFRILQADTELQTKLIQSEKTLRLANDLFNQGVMSVEGVVMNDIYNCLDVCRDGVSVSRDCSVENEAKFFSLMAKIFETIFKGLAKEKAKKYYTNVIRLADSLKPKTFNGQDWFDAAFTYVQAAQQRQKDSEDKASAKWKKPYLLQLKDTLDILHVEQGKGTKGFLEYVYTNHPPHLPEDSKYVLPDDLSEDKTVKRCLKKSLIHYHSDKTYNSPTNDKNDKKWVVLCEEIYKLLAGFYQESKDHE
eukprot:m.27476 g.27476  ORF g.27476 m.27476 type:complete len:580 (-) comp9359_c0_seq1:49-1788(-)